MEGKQSNGKRKMGSKRKEKLRSRQELFCFVNQTFLASLWFLTLRQTHRSGRGNVRGGSAREVKKVKCSNAHQSQNKKKTVERGQGMGKKKKTYIALIDDTKCNALTHDLLEGEKRTAGHESLHRGGRG